MTTLLTVMCAAIGAVGICLGIITKKLCDMIDAQDRTIERLKWRLNDVEMLNNALASAQSTILGSVKDNRKANAKLSQDIQKEAALRKESVDELRGSLAETQLLLHGRVGYDGKSFCGIPAIDPKNEPWKVFKWTFGDEEHGTHS